MMNAKRITALALALVMTLLLAACGSKTVVNDDGTKTEQTERGVKVTQTAAKAVHAAFVGLHTQISGDNENVLGRPDEPRHDTGGDSACADKILSGVAQTAAVRHIGIIGDDGNAFLHRLLGPPAYSRHG